MQDLLVCLCVHRSGLGRLGLSSTPHEEGLGHVVVERIELVADLLHLAFGRLRVGMLRLFLVVGVVRHFGVESLRNHLVVGRIGFRGQVHVRIVALGLRRRGRHHRVVWLSLVLATIDHTLLLFLQFLYCGIARQKIIETRVIYECAT